MKKIMTVDDAATIRKLVTMTLTDAGYEVLQASDGEEALAMLQQKQIDIVITDINMPKMNGIELVRQLRALPNYRRTPILLLTTESDPAKKQEGKAAGATGWITKPFQPEQLTAAVNQVSTRV